VKNIELPFIYQEVNYQLTR